MRLAITLVLMFLLTAAFSFGVYIGLDVASRPTPPKDDPVFVECGPTHIFRRDENTLRVVTDVALDVRF